MASVFISHSSRDQAVTESVLERLRAAGFASLFVDFDPEEGIPAGRNWERELYAQLRKTDAMVFLASEASVGSRWCSIEVGLARSLGRPVIPLRLQPCVRMPLIEDVHWVDFTDGESGFDRLLTGLRAAGLDPAEAYPWDPHRSPYPGLAPFVAEDAAVFFGRERETARLVELLQPTLQRGPGRFVAIVGPSGSGKSSLLRAGLLPRLARSPERWVLVPPLLPGARPTHQLTLSLAQAFAATGRTRPPEELTTYLDRGSEGLVALAEELADLAQGHSSTGRPGVLLIVDQAEELVTRAGVLEQYKFLRLLAGALGEDSPLWVIATLRAEFLTTAPERAGLAEVVDDSLVIEPLSRARLAEVIASPAQRAGLDFEAGLVERMVDETAGGDALPLLAYTLRQLAERAGPGDRISPASYEAIGGVVGALQHQADRLADELARRGHGPKVVPTLLKLVTVGPDGEPTRRRVQINLLSSDEQVVVNAFVDARLVTSDQNPEVPAGEATVDVAHEALLRQWPPLRQAIEDARSWLRLRAELDREAADWQQGGRDESYLLRGGRLATFDEWANQHSAELGPREQDFIEASRALASRELQAARRSNQRLRALAGGLAVLLCVALLAGWVAFRQYQYTQAQRQQAVHDARVAASRQLAAQAIGLADHQPDLALLLGVESLRLAPRGAEQYGRDALATGLARGNHIAKQLRGHSESVSAVAYSPDGSVLASGGRDNIIRLWDLSTGRVREQSMVGHESFITALSFNRDGTKISSASGDATMRIWDVDTGDALGSPLKGHEGIVHDVSFSPDGDTLVSAGDDSSVRIWDVESGSLLRTLVGHESWVRAAAFNAEGTMLATASGDGTVRLWGMPSGTSFGEPLSGHHAGVYDVAFNPGGDTLASSTEDGNVQLWDVATGKPRSSALQGHSGAVRAVAFNPAGTILASASDDATVRLWNSGSGQPLGAPLRGHTGSVNDVAFGPDGTTLTSASEDTTVRLWQVEEVWALGRPVQQSVGMASSMSFSEDGSVLTSAGEDGRVQVWDVATGRLLGQPVDARAAPGSSIALDPLGATLAIAGEDGIIRLWDVPSGRPLRHSIAGHPQFPSITFSPDGRTLASTAGEGTIQLWDVASGQSLGQTTSQTSGEIWTIAFSPDGKMVAGAGDKGTVWLWDVTSVEAASRTFSGSTSEVTDLAFSSDGSVLAAATWDATVPMWDVSNGRLRGAALRGHTGPILSVAASPTGSTFATGGSDATIRLWNAASGEQRGQPFPGHLEEVSLVAFSPDGRILASASNESVRLWDLNEEEWIADACLIANRNLTEAEWDQFLGSFAAYRNTCP